MSVSARVSGRKAQRRGPKSGFPETQVTRDAPVQPFVKTLAARRARGLDVPLALPQGVQPQLVGDLCGRHGVGQVLLVGEHQEHGVAQLVLVEHAVELVAGFAHAVAIVAVHHKDETLGVLEVVPPQGADLVLAPDVPHGERDVLVLDRLDVEACCGGGCVFWGKGGRGRELEPKGPSGREARAPAAGEKTLLCLGSPIVGMVVTISVGVFGRGV